MKYKNFTYKMKVELKKKVKDLDLDKYGYSKNTPEFIELIDRDTGERKVINKNDYSIRRF